ncbi:hypothetical protein RRG08_046840 [Elysia crispata]|uniref:Uncharacterized protein n=1 Tax=Elysia crispata TaxID=231223 RepID=A0AAE0ZN60_9GAST|nr:hypothetical protein RRG08_046840 [Elysia crispata]
MRLLSRAVENQQEHPVHYLSKLKTDPGHSLRKNLSTLTCPLKCYPNPFGLKLSMVTVMPAAQTMANRPPNLSRVQSVPESPLCVFNSPEAFQLKTVLQSELPVFLDRRHIDQAYPQVKLKPDGFKWADTSIVFATLMNEREISDIMTRQLSDFNVLPQQIAAARVCNTYITPRPTASHLTPTSNEKIGITPRVVLCEPLGSPEN